MSQVEFGDDDPLDAWDDSDSSEIRREILNKIIQADLKSSDLDLKAWIEEKRRALNG